MSDVENPTTESAEPTDAPTTDVEASAEPTVAAASATAAEPEAEGSPATRKTRKTREGVVVSNKMDKTAIIAVVERVRHPKYAKFVLQTKRLYAHDETNDVNVGDRVRVMETRPLSKNKRWRVTDVLERAK